MIERIIIVLLGIALVLTSVKSREETKKLEGQAAVWRALYRAAEKDAQYKVCSAIDDNFVICEKPKTK